jgi:hypothetical protein
MSARSRYLAAISPRESDNVVSPTGAGSSGSAGKFDLSSPTAVATRQHRSFNDKPNNASASNVGAAPPPPPPGPPPAKKYGKRRDSSGSANVSDAVKEPVSFRNSRSSNSQNSKEDPYKAGGRTQSFNSQSSSGYNLERSTSAGSKSSNPLSSPKFQKSTSFGKSTSYVSSSSSSRNQSQLNSPTAQPNNNQAFKPSNQQDSPSRSNNGGEVWSPKDEIQSGNVAKFKQMLWGGENASPREGAGKTITPQNQMRSPHEAGADRTSKGDSSATGESITPSQRFGKQTTPQSNFSNQRAPPSTPPRPSSSRLYNHNNQSKGRISTRSPSPPKYKLNAPPSLKLNTAGRDKTPPRSGLSINTGVAPPSRVFHARPEKSPAKGRYDGGVKNDAKNPSPLRQRASGLNLAPIDTSFGGEKNNKSRTSDDSEPSSLLLSGSNARGAYNKGDALSLLGASPSPVHVGGNNKFPFDPDDDEEKDALSPASASISEGNSLPTVSASVANASTEAAPPTPANNPPGVTTVTSFKRPNAKVGIVFTRRSRSSPDVCVISKIMPDSIFSSHEQRYAREEEGGTLKGAEVIAVNGIPVREARHAAELVAGCGEEVRLTVRRFGGAPIAMRSVAERKETRVEETIQEEDIKLPEQESPTHMPQSSPPAMDQANDGPNKTISFDDESEMSVHTEDEEKKEVENEMEQQQDWSNPKSTTSQDIIQRRREIAQAMIMSSEMVQDPISSPGIPEPDDEIEEYEQMTATASEPSSVATGHASAIERRRLAAMKMYQSQEMVEDNVDDVRLGTIDAISPRETVDPVASISSKRLPQSSSDRFGDNASVATTNVTTSSVATQRMGSNVKEFFGDAFSPTNSALTSPQIQRRKERAMQRISRSNSFSRPDTASTSVTPTNATSPTALRSPIENSKPPTKSSTVSSIPSAHSASQIRKNKTDDESVAAISVAASAAASIAAISEASGESRGSRSLFGKKKKQPLGSSVGQTAPMKKKSSIFGVANLIRKVNVSPDNPYACAAKSILA